MSATERIFMCMQAKKRKEERKRSSVNSFGFEFFHHRVYFIFDIRNDRTQQLGCLNYHDNFRGCVEKKVLDFFRVGVKKRQRAKKGVKISHGRKIHTHTRGRAR
jgi:hypothetical protein